MRKFRWIGSSAAVAIVLFTAATMSSARTVGGPPTFANPVAYDTIVSGAQYVVAGDVLKRGIDDLIVTHANFEFGYVSMLKGTGRGTFGPPRVVFKGSTNTQILEAHLADLTGTGKLDLVMKTQTDAGDIQITVALGDGRGNFHQTSQTYVFDGPITIGKFGRNKRDDVFVQEAYALPSLLLISDGSGNFRLTQAPYGGGHGGLFAVAGGGGHLALIGIGQSPNLYAVEQLQTLVGTGTPPYFNAPIYSPPSLLETQITGYNSAISAAAGDLRGNGSSDLLVFGSDFQSGMSIAASVYLGRPDGTFDPPLLVPINAPRAQGDQAEIADFNGDGIADIFMTTSDAGSPMNTYVLRGVGDGTFPIELQSILSFRPLFPHMEMANLKGKGLPDIIVSDQTSGQGVWVILNTTVSAR